MNTVQQKENERHIRERDHECACSHEHEHTHGLEHAHDNGKCSVCELGEDDPACGCCGGTPRKQAEEGGVRTILIRFIVSAALFACAAVVSAVLGMDSAATGIAGMPGWAQTILSYIPNLLFIASWAAAGYEVVISAFRSILKGRIFNENFLMTIATVGAFIIGEHPEAAAVMLFFNLGELLQESAVSRSRRSITDLVDIRPDVARVLRNGEEIEVRPDMVEVGETVIVRPGEKVPLDGTVAEGESVFNTSSLTGESVPRDAIAGVQALSGFVNGPGLLKIRVEKPYSESMATKILEMIETAGARKAPTEKFITSFARVYTPIVVIAALLIAVVPPLITGGAFSDWVYRALVFLVISCPCAFVVSVPLGFFGGVGGAAKRGVLIKGASFIESLAKTDVVVFDKTGTLTRGIFVVKNVETASSVSEDELLALAASAERYAGHPAAQAVIAEAETRGLSIPEQNRNAFSERPGYGVSAEVQGKKVLAGNLRLMEESGVEAPKDKPAGTAIYLAVDGVYAGRIILGDLLKEETAGAVRALKKLGVRQTVMLSGDNWGAAREAAAEAGIDTVYGELLPNQKVEQFEKIVEEAKAANPKARVVFVGDGVNDAPVLARADVGIAMGALGSDAAVEAADVVLMNDDPLSVAEAISLSRRTIAIVRQNIVLSFAIKLCFLALGAFGVASLWEAVFADVGVALLATANAMRVMHGGKKTKGANPGIEQK